MPEFAQKHHRTLLIILLMSYAAGIVGYLSPWSAQFALLTPFHLLLCFAYLLLYMEKRSSKLWIFLAIVFIYTWCVECLGVNTGLLFGEYYYGRVLGLKILGTPLLIGINWLILVLSIGSLVRRLPKWWLRIVLSALLMTLTDVLIEPMAIRYGLWNWSSPEVPLQNYVMWFLVSLPIFALYERMQLGSENRMAAWVWGLQLLFFATVVWLA
jgi:putative membrane protein